MGLAEETARIVNVFDDFHTYDKIETMIIEESEQIRACVSQSNIEALTSCQLYCGLGTLNPTEPTRAKFSNFGKHCAIAAADVENRTVVWY